MSNCIKCGEFVSDEEMRERYEELMKRGIVATMVTMCKRCREYSRYGKFLPEGSRSIEPSED